MEEAIEVWKTEVWPQVEDPRRPTAPGSASKTNYTPDLNPTEGIWSLLKRGALANLAAADLPQLVRVIKRALMKIQYRAHLIDGCLPPTGLTMRTGGDITN